MLANCYAWWNGLSFRTFSNLCLMNMCVLVKLPMMNPNPILPSVDLEGLGVLRKVQVLITKKEHAEGQVAVIDICATKLALASPWKNSSLPWSYRIAK